ncbi:MAG: maleate cis-trans isomerase family protein [Betaproteobacteria bacterium]
MAAYVEKRQRIGLLVPSSNSTQEPEFIQMLPASVSLHVARLRLQRIDAESTLSMAAELEQEARKLGDAQVDVIALAATAPSTRMGKGYDAQLIKRMEDASGKPATTAATAMLDGFAACNVRRVGLSAPWAASTNQWVADFLEMHGVRVPKQVAMGVVENNQVARLAPQTAFDYGRQADGPDIDAVLLACGNWQTASIVEALEGAIGKPVLTTNGLTLWHALKKIGGHTSVPGFGRLLRELPEIPAIAHGKAA